MEKPLKFYLRRKLVMKIPIKADYLPEIQSTINFVQGTATTRCLGAYQVLEAVKGWQRNLTRDQLLKEVLNGTELVVHAPSYSGYPDVGPETVAYLKHDRVCWHLVKVERV
jgi:hypothetical protein